MKEYKFEKQDREPIKSGDIAVAVSELRGDNVLDEETIKKADIIEVKFFDKDYIREKERLVHIFPYYEKAGNKISLDIADEKFEQNARELGLPEKINQINPDWISLHFGWAADSSKISPEEIKKYRKPEIKAVDIEKLSKAVCANINKAKELFPGREILLENLDFVPNEKHGGTAAVMSDPEFISRILKETDTGFLLDMEHAYVSARNLGMKYSEYLSKLPLERVREVHLSRPTAQKRSDSLREAGETPTAEDEEVDFLVDAHKALVAPAGEFSKRVRVILKAFYKRMPNLKVITLEINLPPDEMVKNVEKIKKIIKEIKQGE